uniref:Uncharacterized protein n=1 Tax=Anguilla anguilla TaxID=7936 RepID=A0A0E9S7G4_ANGAN
MRARYSCYTVYISLQASWTQF